MRGGGGATACCRQSARGRSGGGVGGGGNGSGASSPPPLSSAGQALKRAGSLEDEVEGVASHDHAPCGPHAQADGLLLDCHLACTQAYWARWESATQRPVRAKVDRAFVAQLCQPLQHRCVSTAWAGGVGWSVASPCPATPLARAAPFCTAALASLWASAYPQRRTRRRFFGRTAAGLPAGAPRLPAPRPPAPAPLAPAPPTGVLVLLRSESRSSQGRETSPQPSVHAAGYSSLTNEKLTRALLVLDQARQKSGKRPQYATLAEPRQWVWPIPPLKSRVTKFIADASTEFSCHLSIVAHELARSPLFFVLLFHSHNVRIALADPACRLCRGVDGGPHNGAAACRRGRHRRRPPPRRPSRRRPR